MMMIRLCFLKALSSVLFQGEIQERRDLRRENKADELCVFLLQTNHQNKDENLLVCIN